MGSHQRSLLTPRYHVVVVSPLEMATAKSLVDLILAQSIINFGSNHIKENNIMVTISLLEEMRVILVMLVLFTRVGGLKVMILVKG